LGPELVAVVGEEVQRGAIRLHEDGDLLHDEREQAVEVERRRQRLADLLDQRELLVLGAELRAEGGDGRALPEILCSLRHVARQPRGQVSHMSGICTRSARRGFTRYDPYMEILIAVAALVALGLASGVRVLREYERAIVFRLGRARAKPLGPGLVLLLPFG